MKFSPLWHSLTNRWNGEQSLLTSFLVYIVAVQLTEALTLIQAAQRKVRAIANQELLKLY
ncbi:MULTISPECIES: hypothetical protein [Leptolyngbya]|uniref:hypothetical protein n=1 Tax=Leptolyngbya TaxID=47251 RepID=UPI0016878FAD|nr:hypothetical protein [Leptolyngbya sp. FACHB-1624]MBD1855574.1 hypothetical protein [Leptolyngbya sp. FACHB-1624]